ncbi:MAG: VWA domain-containing protein [Acidobacteriota bacterium]
MRARSGPPLLVLTAVLTGAVLTAQGPDIRDRRVFRSGIEVTSITTTVRDSQGRLVTGLEREAFEVFEDGDPQVVTQFTNQRVPIGLGVVLDTSDSMFGQRIQAARAAVERFLFDLLDPGDEYFAMSFNHQPHALTRWTSSPDAMRRALGRLKPSGGTAVYDAIVASLPLIANRRRERAALLVISDGADTASNATLREVRSALLRSDAFVYAIALDSPGRQAINTRVNPTALREITDDSGGRTELVQNDEDLAEATSRIAEELNRQYLIGYTSSHGADGRYHSIRVRVPGTDYKVRARNGYVATPLVR